MNKYVIGVWEPEGEILVELHHENFYTEEEFNNIVAECFAKLINPDFKGSICLCDILSDVKGYMIDVLGFIEVSKEKSVAEFLTHWYFDKEDSSHEEHKLIKKYLDKLKEG